MRNKIIYVLVFSLLVFVPIFSIKAYVPLSLVSYEVSESVISPDNDGVKDTTNIDVKYSEKVESSINILDSQGNKIKDIYNSNEVINPQTKTWDGKDNDDKIVPNGIYTIQILGVAVEDPTNIFSDTSKMVTVDVPVSPIPEVTLSSISITTQASKLTYNIGEVLDISGLVVTGKYSDDSTKIETITLSDVIGFDSTTPVNDQLLTITIGGQTTTYNVNIVETVGGGSGSGGDTNPHPFIEGGISLPDNCLVKDIADKIHSFPQEDSQSKFLGICAFVEAKNKAIINGFDVIEYAPFGLFVDSINSIKDPSAYWALYLNDVYEMRGLTTLPLVAGDVVSLVFVDFNNVQIGPRINIRIDSLVLPQEEVQVENEVSSSRGSISNNKKDFSIENALAFLSSQQKDDGSFTDFMYTDWAGVAFASVNNNLISIHKEKIIKYLTTTPLISDVVTDNERHAMALMSLGINPYSGTEINYIKKIVDAFDGLQFGNKDLVNDDIFAIFPLIKAGYDSSDEIIQKDIVFIVSKQGSDGSWGSVDITSAAIGALSLVPPSEVITKSKTQAVEYLKNAQQADGGFQNSFSTSWVFQAIRALDENILTWTKNNLNPIDYLSSKQQLDGGVEPNSTDKNTRIWATSYAITAVQNKSWADIMQSFLKPASDVINVVKKDTETSEIKYIKKIENLEPSKDLTQEINLENNLGASAGNVPINIPVKNFLKTVGYTMVSAFTYIGKGFLNLITLFTK